MKRLKPVELRPWALPLLALAISAPIVAAFALGGPAGGMAAGAAVTAGILVIAARMRFDEEIEVAVPAADGSGVLVVATAAIEGAAAIREIGAACDRAAGPDAPILVLAPALNGTVSHWLSDLRQARLGAQERLAVSLAVLATAGLDARGSVGDSDPLQATEDALRVFPAGEVVFVTASGADDRVASEVRRRLDRRVTQVAAADSGGARSSKGQPARP